MNSLGIDEVPPRKDLYNPTISAIRSLGGSANIEEIKEQVIRDLNISDQAAEVTSNDGRRVELAYRLAWVRTVLKSHGIINNYERGIWSLTSQGRSLDAVDPDTIGSGYRPIKNQRAESGTISPETKDAVVDEYLDIEPDEWRGQLMDELMNLSPDAFERLCQLLLRVSGFSRVNVTKQTGDGGIDGHGLIRISGLISFPVVFQCKRYSGNVTARDLRDFRGAMQGRADKGLVITTGGFTRDATKEARRDGVPMIDLIHGDLLVELLRDLGLGVDVTSRTIEQIQIDRQFFVSV